MKWNLIVISLILSLGLIQLVNAQEYQIYDYKMADFNQIDVYTLKVTHCHNIPDNESYMNCEGIFILDNDINKLNLNKNQINHISDVLNFTNSTIYFSDTYENILREYWYLSGEELVYLNYSWWEFSSWEEIGETVSIPRGISSLKLSFDLPYQQTGNYNVSFGDFGIDPLEVGVNFGFVSSSPSADPDGLLLPIDDCVFYLRATSPAGDNNVTAMGVWLSNYAANVQVGIYNDSGSDSPQHLLWSNDLGEQTGGNWEEYAVDGYEIDAETTYWLAFQMDAEPGTEYIDGAVDASEKYYYDCGSITDLPTIATSDGSYGRSVTIYALYESIGEPPAECWGYNAGTKTLYVPAGCSYYIDGTGGYF